MSKFHLQSTNMTDFLPKMRFLFVNFLQRHFVLLVNLPLFLNRWEDLFAIVFLDKFCGLCYYIIYIWENSAQNRPIDGVCSARLPNVLREDAARAYVWAPAPERVGDLRPSPRKQAKQ